MTDTEPTARTTAGVVRGCVEDGLQVFRGVPYARPAVGDLRWLAAEPIAAWSGVRDATADGPVCPQPGRGPVPALLGYTIERDAMSEDCLTVTVWTRAADDRRRPVVVWIHGGGFLTGAGTLPLYSGASLAEHGDVVVVAINYRVGPFGYLDCHPDDRSAGNRGLSDQALALQWVADNVAAFGGDPGNITAVGQSGGAWSILTLLGMAGTPSLRRAVLQSPPLGSPMRTADDDARILELRRSSARGAGCPRPPAGPVPPCPAPRVRGHRPRQRSRHRRACDPLNQDGRPSRPFRTNSCDPGPRHA